MSGNENNILITGCAGYIGSLLTGKLLAHGHSVIGYDNLSLSSGDVLLPYMSNPNFTFVMGDIRNYQSLKGVVDQYRPQIIIHLAAIVGYPACREKPQTAESVNVGGTVNLIKSVDSVWGGGPSDSPTIIYASTGSNYGKVDDICTESTPLNPLSLYGITKTKAEQLLLDHCPTIAYRFATAFGVSPRMRLDLLPNTLTCEAVKSGYIVVYEKHVRRTFIHVADICKAIDLAINNSEAMTGEVFNVGDNALNHSKQELCEIIKDVTGCYVHYADVGEDPDKRDYKVAYDKVERLGFRCDVGLQDGIREIARSVPLLDVRNRYTNV